MIKNKYNPGILIVILAMVIALPSFMFYNSGKWMTYCSIAENLTNGIMFEFEVDR